MTAFVCQVCPVCAAYPGGEPNHVIDDLAAHLMLEHRTSNNDLISLFTLASASNSSLKFNFVSYGDVKLVVILNLNFQSKNSN